MFADLALLTSFIGVSLGLFEFMGDSLSNKLGSAKRVKTALITFVPPLGFALFYPQGFIMALGYAAIALAVLAILLPTVMVYKVRYTDFAVDGQNTQETYQVLGGSKALFLAGSVGVFIIAIQFLISVGLLPSLG